MTLHTANQDFTANVTRAVRTRAGAGVEDLSAILAAHVDARIDGAFPEGVADELAELRAQGFDFARAWARIDGDRRARDAGFTWKGREGHVEATLPFAKRHFRAAFERRTPARYCVVTTCVAFACDEYGLCDVHATYDEATAA